jgi:NTE family protein
MNKNRRSKTEAYTLVLGGGAHLGAVQAGQLLALCEAGVEIGRIVGCSVGALNGSYMARGMRQQHAEELLSIWREASTLSVFDRRWRHIMNIVTNKPGISRNERLWELANLAVPTERLEAYPIATEIVTCSLTRGEVVYHTEGPAATLVVASCSMPGVYPPVQLDGEEHVDGGVLDVLPWRRAGDDTTIVLDCRGGRTWQRVQGGGALGVLLASFALARQHRAYEGMTEAANLRMCPSPEIRPGLGLPHVETLAEEAHEIAVRWIAGGGLKPQAAKRGLRSRMQIRRGREQ